MTSAERRQRIMSHIQQHGSGKVDDFALTFNVSAVTIRHDLNVLEKEGCVFRCYGGANLNPNFAFDQPLHRKDQLNRTTKQMIALAAAQLISDGEAVILDSGSTIALMPQHLTQKKLVVMTNALNTAYQLSHNDNVELHVIGGSLRRASCSLTGHHGEQHIRSYLFDKLFLGVDGFDLHAGITTPDSHEAQVNRAMCDVARQVIAVTDSSKFGRKSFCLIRAANQIDVLVTDSLIPHATHQALLEMGVDVIIADHISSHRKLN
ncbi:MULTISPECIES: transcriptional repressor AgaR [Vibrio]|uniref:transcriptional repressor AgaR n=1 Tax=Vibrio TaxID=662 RepID=UPI0005A4EE3E|nr:MULTISPECIES: transcriptional repressor AgaR [Vibrio]EME3968718.1 DeoR/GlpR transcriptional regulator [Vibrio fluvialis]MCG6213161.1 DeoR/GlpR family DNA-binding transcription regulator [Vibrio furnissii]MCG6229171.1 DeoR/GlpR family DNA-binding transcription regulator [Vibrio furnissii]MCG6233721.1 DeoR/GlpR family DNA-binding transcription regulator [Vibrio furnissii]MCG6260457.1 DeoR/GlpR family DNA-binding transcription regulator [Vibrio furnissii]